MTDEFGNILVVWDVKPTMQKIEMTMVLKSVSPAFIYNIDIQDGKVVLASKYLVTATFNHKEAE